LKGYLDLIKHEPMIHRPSSLSDSSVIMSMEESLPFSSVDVTSEKIQPIKSLENPVSFLIPNLDAIVMDWMKGNRCSSVSLVIHEL
jgi:hypothetical protein